MQTNPKTLEKDSRDGDKDKQAQVKNSITNRQAKSWYDMVKYRFFPCDSQQG